MPAPAPSKTWQPTYGASLPAQNILFSKTANHHKELLLLIKQILTGFPTLPWVVQKSSDGAANAGAGDFISTIAHLVWAAEGSNHSWFTIRQTGIGATAEILFNCSNASTLSATIAFAPGGFDTGGTLTNAPTASGGSITLCNNTTWICGNGTPTGRLSVLQSADGHCTRVLFIRNGIPEGFWMFEKLASLPIPASDFGGSVPFFGFVRGDNGGAAASYAGNLDGTHGTVKPQGRIGATVGNAGVTCEGMQQRWHGGRHYMQNALTRGYTASPAGVEGFTTAGVRGLWGMLQDIWITTSEHSNDQSRPNVRLGEHMDVVAGDYGLVNIYGLLLPWPHGAPLLLN
jgi:hypothetical protein